MPSDPYRAIVLAVHEYGDADKIVTAYSGRHGKLAAIAKGAKRSKKRFMNKLEPFTLLEIACRQGRRSSLALLEQAELLDPFPRLRQEYGRYTAAALVCEQVLLWTRENDPDPRLFDLLAWALAGLNQGRAAVTTVILFAIRMLDIVGYRPQLHACVGCGQLTATKAPYRFHPGKNGLICSRCCPETTSQPLLPLSLEAAKLLSRAQELEPAKLERLQFSADAAGQALSLLAWYDRAILQRPPRSWPLFLASLGNRRPD